MTRPENKPRSENAAEQRKKAGTEHVPIQEQNKTASTNGGEPRRRERS